jgi:hypothetical protein
MLSFIEWLQSEEIQKKRKKNGEQYSNQGSGKSGNVDHQGEINGSNQEIQSADVHYIPEP